MYVQLINDCAYVRVLRVQRHGTGNLQSRDHTDTAVDGTFCSRIEDINDNFLQPVGEKIRLWWRRREDTDAAV